MKFLVEKLIRDYENEGCLNFRPKVARPSVSSGYEKAYQNAPKPKLTLRERWDLMWSNPCYPLSHL